MVCYTQYTCKNKEYLSVKLEQTKVSIPLCEEKKKNMNFLPE
jgi:hypothetical protein